MTNAEEEVVKEAAFLSTTNNTCWQEHCCLHKTPYLLFFAIFQHDFVTPFSPFFQFSAEFLS